MEGASLGPTTWAWCPAALLLGMLFFELKRIEVVTYDAEAELQLGRQKRALILGEDEEGVAPAAPSPEAAPS